jgi:hypothetical protein
MTGVHEKISEYAAIRDAIVISQKRLGELELEIRDAMLAENATRYPHPDYDVRITPGRKVYDPDRIRAKLGEIVPPDVLARLAPHEPVQCRSCEGKGTVPAKVSGTEANKVRRYGDEYAHLLDECVVTQGDPVLEITARSGTA